MFEIFLLPAMYVAIETGLPLFASRCTTGIVTDTVPGSGHLSLKHFRVEGLLELCACLQAVRPSRFNMDDWDELIPGWCILAGRCGFRGSSSEQL